MSGKAEKQSRHGNAEAAQRVRQTAAAYKEARHDADRQDFGGIAELPPADASGGHEGSVVPSAPDDREAFCRPVEDQLSVSHGA